MCNLHLLNLSLITDLNRKASRQHMVSSLRTRRVRQMDTRFMKQDITSHIPSYTTVHQVTAPWQRYLFLWTSCSASVPTLFSALAHTHIFTPPSPSRTFTLSLPPIMRIATKSSKICAAVMVAACASAAYAKGKFRHSDDCVVDCYESRCRYSWNTTANV